ncbi:MAG: energy transducer TonB [Luteimonas sp.]
MQDATPEIRSGARPAWLPPRTALLVAALAFVAGLLIFVALWLDQRDSNNFYRSIEAPRSVAGQVFDPLPVPLPAEGDTASGMDAPEPQPAEAPPYQAPPMATAPPIYPSPPVNLPAEPAPAVVVDRFAPQLTFSPPPRYPRDARRRGESGTVLLRVHVTRNGDAGAIELVQGSGSRSLDRAAIEAAHRWRFEPAVRNGEPVESSLQIPVEFAL